MRSRGSRTSKWGFVLGVSLIVCLSTSGGLVAQTSIDFDANGPTMTSELSNFFDFLGADTASWQVDPNLQDPGNDTQALHTASDDGQLEDYFSRVAILKAEVFEAADVDFTVSITWDDAGGDANDHAGAYVRFSGQSGVPTENDYYFVRIDAGGDSSSVTLHKVKDGVHEPLISAQDEPFVIREGDTVTLNVRAAGNEIFVSIDDLEIAGMNPFTDEFEPLLGCGRVGVGQNTNPAYFDDFVIVNEDNAPCPCVVTRELSSRRYQPGEAVTATLRTRNLTGATTITETFTNGLSVTNDGGGNVNGNTISFDLAADGEVSYQLTAPDGFCQDVNFTGTMTGAGGCDTTVGGDGSLVCFEVPVGTLVLNFDDDPPTLTGELPDFFDFLGFDDTGWRVEDNLQNPANGSQALHTTSDGGRLQNYFSRVAVLKQDLFNAQDLSYSLEITWDDMGGNADDHAGAYFRFHGESDEPLENEYYFVRIDAGGDSSRVALHRVKGGRQQRLAQVSDAPRIVREGDTILLTIEAVGNEISVSIDGQAVPGMDPYVDDDALLACGRVGVGQDTNPAYFDEITVTSRDEFPCPCVARRTLSTRRIQGGDTVAVTVRARDLGGASTITETFPTDWAVTNQGGGTVAGNTIAFDLAADGEVSYELEVPDGFCDAASVTGTIAGAGGCQGDVAGDSRLVCVETEGALVLDFDTTEPLTGADLPDFFTFFGFDKDIWSIEPNLQDRRNDTNALHTTSDGNQLANFFSRVAILRPEVFEAENFVYSVDVTFDDLSGDADDHAGVYFRFQGETDDGLANDYYFLRIDAGGTSSSINLHRVKDGLEQRVARVTNDPFTIVEGDTVTLTVRAEGDMISVFVDGLPVPNLSPYLDFDPITGCGAVGVGEQTNPTYFDDFALISLDETPCPCAASRQFSSLIYTPGDRVAVTVKARNITGATTLTETFPDGWAVASAGGGTVNGNTIRFDRTTDGEVVYELDVPGDFCGAAGFSGTLTGAGDCDVEVGGKSGIRCIFGCGELQESGAVSEMLMIGPIDLGGDAGPNCDDNGNLEFTDYLTDGVTDETNLEVIFGDEVQPDFFGAAGGFGVGFSPNPDINPRAAEGVLTVWVADADAQGRINLDDADNVGDLDDYLIYSLVYLENTTGSDLDVTLEVGSADAVKVRVNGEVVHVNPVCRAIDAYGGGDRVITPLAPGLNTVLIALVGDDGTDVRLVVRDAFDLPLNDGSVVACLAPGGPVMPQARFVRGDADANGSINLTDGIVVLNFLFLGQAAPACLDASDTDDDGGERPSLTDAVIIFAWLFSGGTPPREPTPTTPTYPATDCGGDPTEDAMGCESPPAICSP